MRKFFSRHRMRRTGGRRIRRARRARRSRLGRGGYLY